MQGYPVSVQSPRQESAVIKWVLADIVSRADITINNSSGGTDLVLEVGTVMGQQTIGTVPTTGTPGGSNTGGGNMSGVAAAAGAKIGSYVFTCIAAQTHARFEVVDPLGRRMADVLADTAFTGPDLAGEINTSGAAFAVGDTFTVAVPAGAGTWLPVSASAVDGSQIAAGVLYARAFVAADTNDDGAAVIRDAMVIPDTLIWPSGATALQIAGWMANLATPPTRIFPIARV